MSYQSEVLADNPAAYFRLNDVIATGIMVDSAAVPHNGTVSGVTSVAGLIPTDSANNAYSSNNSGHGSFGNAAWNPKGAFSIECWASLTSTTSMPVDISTNTPNGNQDITLTFDNSTHVASLAVWNGSTTKTVSTGTVLPTGGQAFYWVTTFDGVSSVIHYLNAVSVGTGSLDPYGPGAIGGLVMGTFFFGISNNYKGVLDELALYTTALSPSRIAAHYAAAFPPILGGQYTGGRLQLSMQGWVQ